jgi:hypothetical protein
MESKMPKPSPVAHVVQYNGYTRRFASKSAAQKFARSIRGGGCCPCVKPA